VPGTGAVQAAVVLLEPRRQLAERARWPWRRRSFGPATARPVEPVL